MMVAALSVLMLMTAQPASAQATCNPGIGAAYAAHQTAYNTVLAALAPQINTLKTQLGNVVDQATYVTLLTTSRTLAASVTNGRVVVTLPDGTVVLDTARTDDPTNALAVGNSFDHFQNKTVNENHNSRIAIHDAQEWPCGVGLETKLSTTTGQHESYVAARLGNHLDNLGTVRMSLRQ
jgi:hypothetical protein